jgi:hypothetical protein
LDFESTLGERPDRLCVDSIFPLRDQRGVEDLMVGVSEL